MFQTKGPSATFRRVILRSQIFPGLLDMPVRMTAHRREVSPIVLNFLYNFPSTVTPWTLLCPSCPAHPGTFAERGLAGPL